MASTVLNATFAMDSAASSTQFLVLALVPPLLLLPPHEEEEDSATLIIRQLASFAPLPLLLNIATELGVEFLLSGDLAFEGGLSGVEGFEAGEHFDEFLVVIFVIVV
ncbi:hypothetical protein DL95DRAFT_418708 [Leptodontidium sp. 2 PMI_412]|nr:hypothetical protein DL95DRAFT_418708 [Leptodontidium sp. 2 PMI_412]